MKNKTLQFKIVIISCTLLSICCLLLTFVAGLSAQKLVGAIGTTKSPINSVQLSDANYKPVEKLQLELDRSYPAAKKSFYFEINIAMIGIVIVGSGLIFLMVRRALHPLNTLTEAVSQKNANNLNKRIEISQSSYEVKELMEAFNLMSNNISKTFKLQKEFSADAAHELRTPLAVLQTKLDVYELSEHTPEATNQMIYEMKGQICRLSSLVEDLLWFSKDISQISSINSQKLNLNLIIEEVVDGLSQMANDKEINIEMQMEPVIVLGSDSLLERVFYNLIENAIKYSDFGTQITIQARNIIEGTEIFIADQGEGISSKYIKDVFEPFFRINKCRSRTVGGSGLGLSIAKKILDHHNAKIEIYPNIERGTIFKITFSPLQNFYI